MKRSRGHEIRFQMYKISPQERPKSVFPHNHQSRGGRKRKRKAIGSVEERKNVET